MLYIHTILQVCCASVQCTTFISQSHSHRSEFRTQPRNTDPDTNYTMPIAIGRNLIKICFVKIKSPLAIAQSSSSVPNSENPDLQLQDRPPATNRNSRTPPCANICSSIFVKNFNSLYDNTCDYASKTLTNTSSDLSDTSTASASTSYEPEADPEPADFVTAFASNRFFFSSPGRSNSITESTNNSVECCIYSSSSSSMAVALPGKNSNNYKHILNTSMAVSTYSPDPYADFRRSMQEMVEARASREPAAVDVKFNWEFLHELLLCYLVLNPHPTHKFIVHAFSDLLVSLKASVPPPTMVVGEGRGRLDSTGGAW